MALTKAQLVEDVHQQIGFSREDSVEIIEILIELIKYSLERGNDVQEANSQNIPDYRF